MYILWIICSILIFLGILGMLYERIKKRLFWYNKAEAERSLLRSKIYYSKERKVVRKSQEENTDPKVKTPDQERKDTTKVILTQELVDSARTANGGLTKHQLEAIGIEWPPKKGSIKSKIGTEITQEQLEQFLTVEYVKKGKKK